MNKLIIPLMALSGHLLMAQSYPQMGNDHELKFNIGLFLANTTVEGSYEYYLNGDTSVGGTVYFDDDATDYNGDFGIGGNFRAYFGYVPRSGFFAEVFGLYYTGEEETGQFLNDAYNTLALGVGFGNKWATRSQKFTLELHGGLGRNIDPEDFQDTFMYRAGLSVGFRF